MKVTLVLVERADLSYWGQGHSFISLGFHLSCTCSYFVIHSICIAHLLSYIVCTIIAICYTMPHDNQYAALDGDSGDTRVCLNVMDDHYINGRDAVNEYVMKATQCSPVASIQSSAARFSGSNLPVAEINDLQYEAKREMEEQLTNEFAAGLTGRFNSSRLKYYLSHLTSIVEECRSQKPLIIFCLIKSLTVDGCKLGKAHGKELNLPPQFGAKTDSGRIARCDEIVMCCDISVATKTWRFR
jgi:hypothetical protein